MTKAKSTKRALLMSVLAMLLCCSMLVGSTFAWFTDSASSNNNKIIAGNLDIELEVEVGGAFKNVTELTEAEKLFVVDAWEPGVVAYQTFKAVNNGSLALKYATYLSSANANAVMDGAENTGRTLADVLKVAVIKGAVAEGESREALVAKLADLQALSNAVKAAEGALEKGAEEVFTVVVYWEPTNNDNLYNVNNGKTTSDGAPLTIDFGVTLSATQAPVEEDSFGSDYDANIVLVGHAAMTNTINQGAKDSNAAIVAAIKEIAKENNIDLSGKDISKMVYFDDALEMNDAGEMAITLHFADEDSINYVNAVFTAVKTLIGNAVNAQAGNIYSIQIVDQPEHILNGNPIVETVAGDWVETDLRAVVDGMGSIPGALEAARDNGGLPVTITDMAGNMQVYRMNFELNWN